MGLTVKKGIEHFLYSSFTASTIVGGINIDGPGSGALDLTISGVGTLPDAGQVLLVTVDQAVLSDVDIDIDITGDDPADITQVGNVIIPARAARQRAVKVDVAADADDLFKTVESIVVNSGGVAGDTLIIVGVPEYDRLLTGGSIWNFIGFFDGLDLDLGAGTEPIFDKYEPDHNKRTRLDNAITITARYTDIANGLMPLDGAEVSLRIEVKPDGRALVTEQHFIVKAKMAVTPSIPEGEGIVTAVAEGNFSKSLREQLVADQ